MRRELQLDKWRGWNKERTAASAAGSCPSRRKGLHRDAVYRGCFGKGKCVSGVLDSTDRRDDRDGVVLEDNGCIFLSVLDLCFCVLF